MAIQNKPSNDHWRWAIWYPLALSHLMAIGNEPYEGHGPSAIWWPLVWAMSHLMATDQEQSEGHWHWAIWWPFAIGIEPSDGLTINHLMPILVWAIWWPLPLAMSHLMASGLEPSDGLMLEFLGYYLSSCPHIVIWMHTATPWPPLVAPRGAGHFSQSSMAFPVVSNVNYSLIIDLMLEFLG